MNLEELRKYLDEKFFAQEKLMDERFESNASLLEQRFKNVDLQLNHIKEQTTRTNGRVTKLEEKEDEIKNWHLDCPVKREFEEYKGHLENDLFLIRFSRRYPKLFYGVIVLIAIVIFSGGITNFTNLLAAVAKAILGT